MADKKRPDILVLDPNNTNPRELEKISEQLAGRISPLQKSILGLIQDSYSDEDKVTRLAFEVDPSRYSQYSSIFYNKDNLLPDRILRRISVQDDLVATIARIRGNQVATFGRHKENKYSIGFEIIPNEKILHTATSEEKEAINRRIQKAIVRFSNCGDMDGIGDIGRLTLPQCLFILAQDAVILGRFAVEKIHKIDPVTGKLIFHSFRPMDAGTLMRAVPYQSAVESIRKQARIVLEKIKNEKIKPELFKKGVYKWVQVIDGKPLQAFTDDEVSVVNCYPTSSVEFNGYPVSPLDTIIAATATHINITNFNKIYFQQGRAARGMLVFKSEDATVDVINQVRQVFNASINGVSAAWRMPVFSVSRNDEINWVPIEVQGNRDGEFNLLSQLNARTILSAFGMSPDEIPAYNHLGSKAGALAGDTTSKNELLLEESKDVGIRPLLRQFQDFLNYYIFPLIDPELSKIACLVLGGIDDATPAEETAILAQQMPLWGTMNRILQKMELPLIPESFGGEFPFNEAYRSVLDAYFTVGEIRAFFFGDKKALEDPMLNYRRDPLWFQQVQMVQTQQQMEIQKQQMGVQQQADHQQDLQAQDEAEQGKKLEGQAPDVATGVDQLLETLDKSEKKTLTPSQKKLLQHHNLIVRKVINNWEKDSKILIEEIINKSKNNI